MSEIARRALTRRTMLQGSLAAIYPTLLRKLQVPAPVDRSAIVLGRNQHGGAVMLPQRARMEHCHAIGTTGAGKSYFLAHCICQDIANGSGVVVIDPHGEHPDSLYRYLIGWVDRKRGTRAAALRSPHRSEFADAYRRLQPARAPRSGHRHFGRGRRDARSVLARLGRRGHHQQADNRTGAHGHVRGARRTQPHAGGSPIPARSQRPPWAAHVCDCQRDRPATRVMSCNGFMSCRSMNGGGTTSTSKLSARSIASPASMRPTAIRAMKSARPIACSISALRWMTDTSSSATYPADRACTNVMPISSAACWCAPSSSTRRGDAHRAGRSSSISTNATGISRATWKTFWARSRKYGIAAVLAHQWLAQLAVDDDNMLAAVRNATNLKLVFRIKDPVEAEELAHAVVPLDLELPVKSLVKPTVVGHRRIRLGSESTSEQIATTDAVTKSQGTSESHTVSYAESEAVMDAESESVSESEALSAMDASSRSNLSGVGESITSADMMTPAQGIFGTPTIIGMSEGTGLTSHTASGTASSSASGRTAGSARATGSTHAVTHSSAWGESIARGSSRATSIGRAETRGTGRTQGTSEGLEPILAELPSAVHGKENVLYMAAQTLRTLATGRAFINYVGKAGMVPVLLTVPRISEHPLSAEAFAALRERILAKSAAATPVAHAVALVSAREQKLLDARTTAGRREIPEPRKLFEHGRRQARLRASVSRPAAAVPVRARKVSNDNRVSSIETPSIRMVAGVGECVPCQGRHSVPIASGDRDP